MTKWAFTSRIQRNRVEVYVVDEHGCQLNTEPVCVIFAEYHPWFVEWLKTQPCEYPDPCPLLWHPALGESLDSHLKMGEGLA